MCYFCYRSSGLTNDGVLNVSSSSRQVTCPPGETNINDIALNSTGSVLYSAAGNTVKIWDLRRYVVKIWDLRKYVALSQVEDHLMY